MADTLAELLTAAADHARSVLIPSTAIKRVYYPVPSKVEATPALLLMSGGGNAAIEVTHEGPGEQMWAGTLHMQLLVDRARQIGPETAAVDGLVFAVTDAFSIDANGQGVELPGFTHNLDRLVVSQWFLQLGMEWGAQKFAGADIYLDFKFHRVWDTE